MLVTTFIWQQNKGTLKNKIELLTLPNVNLQMLQLIKPPCFLGKQIQNNQKRIV